MKSEELQQMTKEELLKMIEELKEENTNLKSKKYSARDTSRNVLPDELFTKFNGVRHPRCYKNSVFQQNTKVEKDIRMDIKALNRLNP